MQDEPKFVLFLVVLHHLLGIAHYAPPWLQQLGLA